MCHPPGRGQQDEDGQSTAQQEGQRERIELHKILQETITSSK